MDYQILFCDMDHTLLDDDLKISPVNLAAIEQLLLAGKEFVICTGRGIYGVESYIMALHLQGRQGGYVICQNGGTVYSLETGKLLLERSFSMETLRPVIKAAHHYHVDIQLYYDRTLMAEKLTPRIARYIGTMNTNITLIPNALDYNGNLTKCLLNGSREGLLLVKEAVEKVISTKLNMFFTDAEYLEFTAPDANKGNAMLKLAEELHIGRHKIIAMGDSENDKSMIEMAGLGIAVENAQPKIKEAAGYVTIANNCQGAVAEVIYKFML